MDPQQLQTASRQQQAVSSLNSSPSEGSSTTDDVLSFPFIPVDSSRSFHDVPVAISWHTANHPQRLLVVTASGLVDVSLVSSSSSSAPMNVVFTPVSFTFIVTFV